MIYHFPRILKRYGPEAMLRYIITLRHSPNFETIFVESTGIHQTAYNGYFWSSIDFGHSILFTFIFQIIHGALYCFHIWEKLYPYVKIKKKKKKAKVGSSLVVQLLRLCFQCQWLGFNSWSRNRDSVSQAVWQKKKKKKTQVIIIKYCFHIIIFPEQR